MRTKAIRRTVVTLLMVGLMVGVGLGAETALASGGGGCGRRVTDQRGTTISIKAFCFGPTVLRVPLGKAVTWVNNDPFGHTVLGANAVWGGFNQLKTGARVTYRFARPGVYPYVCTFHPGMVGVVVVGSANGPGAARTTVTKAGPVTLVEPGTGASDPATGAADQAPASTPAVAIAPASGWLAGASWAIGLLLVTVAAAAAVWSQRRNRVAAR